MARYCILIIAGLLTFTTLGLPLSAEAQPQSPYQRGLEQLYRGQVEDALSTWEESYEDSERVDSRIGFEYIRIITEREFDDHFETATEMYYKAVMNGSGVNSRIALRQEIERLKAIVGDGIYRQWTEWWEAQNNELRTDIRGYWIQLDPTPSRTVNERLIEHWQRIAESRNRFTKNNSTIYGTDERAMIYVRYGEPDRVQTGILTLQDLNVKPWLERQIVLREDHTGDDVEARQSRDRMGESGSGAYSAMQTDALEYVIYDNHRYPEYEIWFYDDITTTGNEPVPYIFGTNIRTDQFELRSGIEEFIPERAYNVDAFGEREITDFTRSGLTPALMLQMLYYEQLSTIDP
ncbi:GWxTD domain-containing protein, partial [Rhodohalobacter sp. SW132]|uniref:GWxTD domain-containing protein n=1 Tax=Rhodohalobacter sp. SW132 TaxID=2293433 RepID=UPI000E25735D